MNASLNIGHGLVQTVKGTHELTADAAVLSEAVACASASDLVSILDQMLSAGEVRVDDEPALEDVQDSDEDCSELEYGDDDVDNAVEDSVEEFRENAPFRNDVVEIRVRKIDGKWLCDIPQSGWEGVIGIRKYGKKAVTTVSSRMHVYYCIAQLLENKHQDILMKGPHSIKEPICSQRELLSSECFSGLGGFARSKDGGASSLRRYLRSVDLVWKYGSIPLRRLFAE